MRKGFSLIEIMIAVSLSGMVFILVSSMMVLLLTSNSKSQRQESFEQVKNNILVEISNAVRWSEVVTFSPNRITTDTNVYELSAGAIVKNGEKITPDDIEITKFEIKNYSGVTGWASLEVAMEMRNRNYPLAQDKLRLVVSQRKTTVTH